MTEDQLEQETLGWLTETGYGLNIAPDGSAPEWSNYSQVLLVARLREAIDRLNPFVPPVAGGEPVFHQRRKTYPPPGHHPLRQRPPALVATRKGAWSGIPRDRARALP